MGAPEGWPSLGSALEMPALSGHYCPPMYKRIEKAVLLPCTASISGGEAFIPVWASGCRLSAMTIASYLMDGCGLSHECVRMAVRALVWSLGSW